jgi:catechol 2,3-dioxygenase-like lactoylglutathione lyase family enzyme
MVKYPLAHISWALADNIERKACDAFLTTIFGARTAYEVLMTPEVEAMGLDREESLLVVGNTMLISIAPAGPGNLPQSAIGTMLRKHARPGMWIGIALSVADLDAARNWARARGFTPKSYAGMEARYFLLDRRATLGVRLEFLCGALQNDPRIRPDWQPEWWRDSHPLGIEGLQSIGVSTTSLDAARAVFSGKLGWPEVSCRTLPGGDACGASFLIGDTVIEALQSLDVDSPLAEHSRDIQGIYCLTFKVRSATAAAAYLRSAGLELLGDPATRFAIRPDQAFGRLLYFTDQLIEGYPPLGTLLSQPAQFPE